MPYRISQESPLLLRWIERSPEFLICENGRCTESSLVFSACTVAAQFSNPPWIEWILATLETRRWPELRAAELPSVLAVACGCAQGRRLLLRLLGSRAVDAGALRGRAASCCHGLAATCGCVTDAAGAGAERAGRTPLPRVALVAPYACRSGGLCAMVDRPAGSGRACGARVLMGALAAIALCATSALGAADSDASGVATTETAKAAADSCETGSAHGGSLSGWIVLQWTLVMALARCVGQARSSVRRRICLSVWLRRHSGLGAVPFFLIPPDQLKGELVGAANAVAAGVTLAASFGTQTRAHATVVRLRSGRSASRTRYAVQVCSTRAFTRKTFRDTT